MTFETVQKTIDDQDYSFVVPAFSGSAEDIANRYGLDNLVKTFISAKFPSQSVAKMLKDGKSVDDVQDWLHSWEPGSRSRLTPGEKLLREAKAAGVYDEVLALLRKNQGSEPAPAGKAAKAA